jgi:predicted nuclease of predicted toxin-antitoxin system
MKILLDSCIHGSVFKVLQAEGFDVVWAGNWESDPGDIEILAIAYQEKRILFTLDNDFGELAIVQKQLHAGIVRLVGLSSRQQQQVSLKILQDYSAELEDGAILTADMGRVRIRSRE